MLVVQLHKNRLRVFFLSAIKGNIYSHSSSTLKGPDGAKHGNIVFYEGKLLFNGQIEKAINMGLIVSLIKNEQATNKQ